MMKEKNVNKEKNLVLGHVLSREEVAHVAGGSMAPALIKTTDKTTNAWKDENVCTPSADGSLV